MADVLRTYWLNLHVGYACRNSGACCASGWPIPIERDRAALVDQTLAAGLVQAPVVPWRLADRSAPPDVAGILAMQPDGHCVWHQRPAAPSPPRPLARSGVRASPRGICTASLPSPDRGCAIYSSRPASCAHFPFACLVDARGVHVTLSHYCPTAASMLFAHAGDVAVVEGPPPVPEFDVPEGLDARESLPPPAISDDACVARGVGRRLMGFDEFAAWERAEVRRLGAATAPDVAPLAWDHAGAWFEAARAAVPGAHAWAPAPADAERAWTMLVAPTWSRWAAVVGRYLAARLFASWSAYLGDGLPAVRRGVERARAVLQVECARQCARAGRPLDVVRLTEAIRQADLLLVHYADPARLAVADGPAVTRSG